MTTRLSYHGSFLAFAAIGIFAFAIPSSACSDDASTGPSPQVQAFCQNVFAAAGFSCCNDVDRGERQFATRYRYQSATDCAERIGASISGSEGRQSFDQTSADSCLAHLGSRKCGAEATTTMLRAEEQAGCSRIVLGKQTEGQTCTSHEDCQPGLLCPPVKATGGLSFCAKPAAANQSCIGSQSRNSVDHPACLPGLFCQTIGEIPGGCAAPPCIEYKCVPFLEAGETCAGPDCADGLACLAGTCAAKPNPPSQAGGPCTEPEHCAEGLYCDTLLSQCAAKKAAGAECRGGASSILECRGFCKGDGPGVCTAFCGSG